MREAIFLVLCFMVTSYAQDYVVVMPSEVRPGMEFPVDIFYGTGLKVRKDVEFSLRKGSYTGSDLAWSNSQGSLSIETNQQTGRTVLMAPSDLLVGTNFFMFVKVNGATRRDPKKVTVTSPVSLILIQTDKGIYKPGDLVKLRILTLNDDLTPRVGASLLFQIKDPKGSIVMMENDLATNGGLASREFPIPDDPIRGPYLAYVEGTWGKANVTFDVAEYVLPKFEVKLELTRSHVVDPAFYGEINSIITISGKVRAVYTYGAFVKGTMKITVGDQQETFTNFDGESSFSFEIPRERGDSTHEYTIYAEMSEQHTDILANDTKIFSVHDSEWRTLIIEPFPELVEGSFEYKLFAQLVDSNGQRVENIEDFSYIVDYEISYQNPRTYNYETERDEHQVDTLFTNPVEITLPVPDMEKAYYSDIRVTFVESSTKREALYDSFTPVKYESNSNNALFIDIVDKNTEALLSNTETYTLSNPEVCFRVRSSFEEPLTNVFYQVIGNFNPAAVHPLPRPDDPVCLDLLPENAPKSVIMAYMLYNDGSTEEILVASVTISLQWMSRHQVTLKIVPETQYPNKPVKVQVETDGPAVVGLSVIDKSLTYLAQGNDITNQRLISAIEKFQIFNQDKKKGGNNYPGPVPMWRGWMPPRDESDKTSPGNKLEDAGLTVISDVQVYKSQGDFWRDKGGFPIEEALGPMPDGNGNEDDGQQNADSSDSNESLPPQESSIRTEFPESWLFDIVTTDSSGKHEVDTKCPGTITTWLLNAFAMNDENGIGVAPTAELKCFQPFFVSLNLPYSIVRSEDFDLQIIIFNYNNDAMDVQLTLSEQNEFDILNGVSPQTTMNVQGGSSALYKIPIKPKILGDITLEVQATGGGITDKVVKPLLVKPEGKEIRVSKEISKQITTGQTQAVTFNYGEFFATPEEDVVRDSLRMWLEVNGDMMGTFIENMDRTVRIPTGCGEQNMVSLVPSIYVAKYLKSIKRYTQDMRKRVSRNCGIGYTKELNFMHDDGGFSAFGDKSLCGCMPGPRPVMDEAGPDREFKPSTTPETTASSWLTAFVMGVFSVASIEELTYIDLDVLEDAFDFLARYTDKTNAADSFFVKKGSVIHKEMQGGTGSGVTFTASVIIQMIDYMLLEQKLLESSRPKRDVMRTENLVKEALNWMWRQKHTLANPFSLFISAYAMAKGGEYDNARLLLSTAENFKSTELKCPERPPYFPCADIMGTCNPANCKEGYLCCPSYCGAEICTEGTDGSGSSMIEAEGYAVLAYLALDDYDAHVDQLRPHAEKLLKERKEGGSYYSSQDTMIALQALSEYASKYKNESLANFMVTVPTLPSVQISVNSDNYQVQQREQLDIQWVTGMANKTLTVNLDGTSGEGYVTLVAYYNTKNNQTINTKIDLTTEGEEDVDKSVTWLKPCFQPVEPVSVRNPEPVGDMFILQVTPQSGQAYAQNLVDLQILEENGVTKIEKAGEDVVLYFQLEESNKYKKRCVNIPLETQFEVRNKAMGKVEVYDYYNPATTRVERFYASEPCYTNCGPTTKGPTTGASSVYISVVLLVTAFFIAIGNLLKKE